jgi:ferredoxin
MSSARILRSEMIVRRRQLRVEVDHVRCFSCGACVAVCPPNAIFLHNAHLSIDHEACTLCERCPGMCPVHALSLVEALPNKSE